MKTLQNKRIVLGISGSIAAYKSAELTRRLRDEGADVRVVMTQAATAFITPLTLQALSGHTVHTDLMDAESEAAMGHIELARWADLILIAPASADTLARLAGGRADDLLSAICLATQTRIALAPAMNHAMWSNPATQENISILKKYDHQILGPAEGDQACGETGFGRMLDVSPLLLQVRQLFISGLLSGKKIVVTAGPTREPIDPVRFISNHSSGKMGFALAQAAIDAGAEVSLICGPVHIPAPERATCINVETAKQMQQATLAEITDCDIFIATAAVADYRPATQALDKIKKDQQTMQLKLTRNHDILASVAALPNAPFTVGFAAETDNLLDYARSKLSRKNLDMIIANAVGPGLGFNQDDNELDVLWLNGHIHLDKQNKQQLAHKLMSVIAERLHAKNTTENTG